MAVYTSDASGDFKVGNKEYYSNVIKDISPTTTPLFNMIAEEMVDSVSLEFYSADLATPDGSNDQASAQGASPTAVDENRILMVNRTQIFMKSVDVSDTQEVQKKVGISSELDWKGGRMLAHLKQNYEARCLTGVHYRSPKTNATASLMMGMAGFIARWSSPCNGGTSYGTLNTTNVNILIENFNNSGSLGAMDNFEEVNQKLWDLGGEPTVCIMSSRNKRYVSKWDSSGVTRNISDPRKVIQNVEFLEGDFNLVKMVPHRSLGAYSDNGTDSYDGVTGECVKDFAFLFDPSNWRRLTLKGYNWQSEDLARTGLKTERMYKFQGSLKCFNPGGSCVWDYAGWASHSNVLGLYGTAASYDLT